MKITPIAWSMLNWTAVEHAIPAYTVAPDDGPVIPVNDLDTLGEIAGRQCYRSWGRPNPATATIEGYIGNIIKQQHFSVLEHGSVTFHVNGVSRTLLTELERHRHLSFSVVSQRYVNEAKGGVVYPPDATPAMRAALKKSHEAATTQYEAWVKILLISGYSVKDARSAARAFLLNSHETEFIVTGNLRTWREIIQKRLAPGADKEIQVFAGHILVSLKQLAPASVQDLFVGEGEN